MKNTTLSVEEKEATKCAYFFLMAELGVGYKALKKLQFDKLEFHNALCVQHALAGLHPPAQAKDKAYVDYVEFIRKMSREEVEAGIAVQMEYQKTETEVHSSRSSQVKKNQGKCFV